MFGVLGFFFKQYVNVSFLLKQDILQLNSDCQLDRSRNHHHQWASWTVQPVVHKRCIKNRSISVNACVIEYLNYL